MDYQLQLIEYYGLQDKPLTIVLGSGNPTHSWYLDSTNRGVNVSRWVAVLEAYQRYLNRTIHAIEPFKDPDYWGGQGGPGNLRDVLVAIGASPQTLWEPSSMPHRR